MHNHRDGRRLRAASAALLVAVLIGAAGLVYANSFDAAWWRALERASERNAQLRGVPQAAGTNESADIQERAQRTFNRLAYPASTIPPAWRSHAASQIRQRVRDGADFFPGGGPLTSAASPDSTQPVGTTSWTGLGPAPIDNNAASSGYKYGLVTGRINALAVSPANSAVAYAGATAGGLWKTTNCCSASTSWSPLWEGKDAVIQSVGAIAISSDGQTLYVGTGDFDAADQFSEGIMKSTDAGATWTQLGADVFTPYAAGTPDKPEQNIGSIEIDPRNANTVLVGTRHGFFVSYDAGATWARYNVHSLAGESQRVSSIVLDGSTNPTTMYVAIGYPYSSRLYGNIGGGNGIYKATIPASGAPSFTKLTSGFPQNTVGGTANTVGRIELAKSAQNPQIIYAQVSNYDINFTNALGTWVTTNGGGSWAQLSGSADTSYKNCSNAATSEAQDWYDLFVGVDPSNDKTLYIGRTSLYKIVVNSTYTGVSSITNLANVYSQTCAGYGTLHPDQHAVAMISSSQFVVGNDGGIYLGSGAVGGFTAMQNGLNISQFYAGQLGANFASSSSQFAFGGMQDNGSASWDAANTSQQWQARGNGGDGFFAAFDPLTGSRTAGNWYTEYTYGDLACSTTGAQGAFNSCNGAWYSTLGAQVDRSDWSTPFTLDQLHCTNASCRNIILGTYRMWASGTGGTSRAGWTAVSPDLTKGNITTDTAANTIIDVRFAPSSPTSAVVGTDDGNVQWSNTLYTGANCTQAASGTAAFACTPNASASWVNLTGGNAVLPNRAIQGVGFDPSNAQVVYAAVGGFNTNTPGTPGHLFQASRSASRTSAASWSWVDKSSNLPDVPADSVIANPNNRKQVFVGTHSGSTTPTTSTRARWCGSATRTVCPTLCFST
ncbi:WD40/YVTN/BNR-like repeat-containing protein [Kouleothrix sp.]|uniref:WD40/YVTN/BNR-like repeat-containing protein n=1 Tax=Kouleothrix sp. TaxID=2779161 RepID=UPI00391A5852